MIGRRGRAVSGAFVFLLLGVFAVFATLLVLLGARAYHGNVDRSDHHSAARVLENYLVNAVRADDAAGAVSVKHMDGMDALHIAYDFDGEAYAKWIYCSEGAIRELFVSEEFGFDAASGEAVCEAQSMQLEENGSLITAAITDPEGSVHETCIALRCPA